MCSLGSEGQVGLRNDDCVSVYNIAGNLVMLVHVQTADTSLSLDDAVRSEVAYQMRVPCGLLICFCNWRCLRSR